MSNLPDDWNSYRSRCPRCKGWRHASGAEVCACEQAFMDGERWEDGEADHALDPIDDAYDQEMDDGR